MMKRIQILMISCLIVALTGCFGVSHRTEILIDPLQELADLMTGTFTSEAQAAADTNYYDITLNMWPIWTGHANGPWLYVEQALSSNLEQPYRQRIYQLGQVDDSTFSSAVFELPHPERFVQSKNDSALFATLTPDSLLAREGCTVFLNRVSHLHFSGSTHEADCLSDFRGASYATSRVEVEQNKITSWDQGWDSLGVQVWGATQGGYVFDRVKSLN